jgi:hypothetical protein
VKFVLVNGRTPYPQTFCMLRCESIKSGYLRATTTQYPYCDYECYSHYCESVARLREAGVRAKRNIFGKTENKTRQAKPHQPRRFARRVVTQGR